jgi:hypothetical protein
MHLWALRAIENGQMVLNDNDLIDFINIAKTKTWGYFRIHLDNPEDGANIDNSCSNSEIYCMFVNRRRKKYACFTMASFSKIYQTNQSHSS